MFLLCVSTVKAGPLRATQNIQYTIFSEKKPKLETQEGIGRLVFLTLIQNVFRERLEAARRNSCILEHS